MTITLPPSAKADLLNRLADNPTERTLDRLAGDLGLLLPEAKALVQKHGWPRPESMRRAAQVLVSPSQGREAKAKLRGKKAAAPSSSGTPAKVVRAWAADNEVTCPPVGRVPASVVEAYEAAQGRAS